MEANINDFIPVRLSTLRGDQTLLFDVYIKVAGKQILYCREGDSFDGTRLQRLKEKKIKQLFIKQESEAGYRQYLSQNIQVAYANTAGKPIEMRSIIIKGLQQAATEEVLENPTEKIYYEAFKDDTKRYVEFLLMEQASLKHILLETTSDSSVARHGVNVASLAVAIAESVGIQDTTKLQLLATGCLLHDIEHVYSGLNVARPVSEIKGADLSTYRNHTDLGVARLQQSEFYDQIVLKIIGQHHEYQNGTGFPKGLKEQHLDEMVMIAAVADTYDRYINYEGIPPKDAIKQLLLARVGLLPLPLIQNLNNILKERGIIN